MISTITNGAFWSYSLFQTYNIAWKYRMESYKLSRKYLQFDPKSIRYLKIEAQSIQVKANLNFHKKTLSFNRASYINLLN